jgi:hypothetical protein
MVPAPGRGPGHWAGAPSGAFDVDGTLAVAYRVRTPDRRGSSVILATSPDGEHLAGAAVLDKERFGAESLERPALVPAENGWRIYVSCATPGTKHWRIDLLEAPDLEGLAAATPRTVFPGDEHVGVKDPVIRRLRGGWQAWICCHPLEQPGDEDRMTTAYATSADGVEWRWHGTALAGRPGRWDSRGARVTAVLPDGRASYDGRASKEENFSERTGVADPTESEGALFATGDSPVADVRYLDLIRHPEGGYLALYEAPLGDGSHELRAERFENAV